MTNVLKPRYDDANVFRRILDGQAPCHQVFEDEHSIAFLDIAPQGPGHTLVIPKICAANIFDLPCDISGNLFRSVQAVSRILVSALNADGLEIFQFNGAAAGQTVFHIHFHLIPRFKGVPILSHSEAKLIDDGELRVMANLIGREV
jgi:histidine triad (HIT) family protein